MADRRSPFDENRQLAIDRAKSIWSNLANVQPHSGAQACRVFLACLKAGDPILVWILSLVALALTVSPVNFSEALWSHFYGVEEDTGLIDYEKCEAKALWSKPPKMIICGLRLTLDDWELRSGWEIFANIKLWAHSPGRISHPIRLDWPRFCLNWSIGHFVYRDTTTHKTLRGPRGGLIMNAGKTLTSLGNYTTSKRKNP